MPPSTIIFDQANQVLGRGLIAYHAPRPRELVLGIAKKLRDTNASLVSEQLSVDSPRAPQPLFESHASFPSIRISTFFELKEQLNFSGALLSLFASLGCLAVSRRTPQLQTRATLHTSHATPTVPANVALECAFCAASIPVANVLPLVSSHDRAQYTVERLAALAMKHAEDCTGRRGVESLKEDDAHMPVTEGCTKMIEGKH